MSNPDLNERASKQAAGQAKLDFPPPIAKQEEWKLSEAASKAKPAELAQYLASNYLIALGIKSGEQGFDKNGLMFTSIKGDERNGIVYPPQTRISYIEVDHNGTGILKDVYIRLNDNNEKTKVEYSSSPISEMDGKSSGRIYSDFINFNREFISIPKSAKDIIEGLDEYLDIGSKVKKGREADTRLALENHHKNLLGNDTKLIKAAEAEFENQIRQTVEVLRKVFFPFKLPNVELSKE